jgi:sarcosine oxidase gamma subunit
MNNALSKRARDALGPEYRYARREWMLNEAPPRTFVPARWEPLHPDLVAHVARLGANDHQHIKSRGMG